MESIDQGMAMNPTVQEPEEALIDAVCDHLHAVVAPEPEGRYEAFVRQFYRWVPAEDLAGRTVRDLCGAALAMLELVGDHGPGSASVRAYNPRAAQHGWESPSTIVEVVTDDMPFLVDSVGMELGRRGYGIRRLIVPVIDVLRAPDGRLAGVFGPGAGPAGSRSESVMQYEIARQTEPARLQALVGGIRQVLADVRAAVEDWPTMRQRLHEIVTALASAPPPVKQREVEEACAFLEWLDRGNFVFLGFRDYDLRKQAGEDVVRAVDGSGLGILRRSPADPSASFATLPPEVRSLARALHPLILAKANSRSTVHRPLYLDYIGVKRFAGGEVCGERRFLGLYTTAAEQANPREVPILRGKVERVMRRAAFAPQGHHAKALARVLETYPRDELLQVTDDELFATAMGIVALGERGQVRLFARSDPYRRYVSCLVFLPRDRYNTDNRERIASVLGDTFAATEIDWDVRLSESKLARIHYRLRTSTAAADCELSEIERRIARVTRPWTGDLADVLRDVHGEEPGGALFRRYRDAFPIAYRAATRARTAVADIDRAEAITDGRELLVSVYLSDETDGSSLRCKLLRAGERLALSDVLPIFENMGLRVDDERLYELWPDGQGPIWIYDIGLACPFDADLRTEATRAAFQDAFAGVWMGDFENDRLGALVLKAGLSGREVALLRALIKYQRQAGTTFSDRYLQRALIDNPATARLLVETFAARLDPDRHALEADGRLEGETDRAIDQVASGDQRRILRHCLAIIRATVRTNYFQRSGDGRPKPLLSLKLDPSQMPFLPSPRPRLETFVYSPRVEGVYLRAGRVARGGIRLSERREGFRAEALELMDAAMVRNAVIAPAGGAGAFVTKRPPSTGGRRPLREDPAECYGLMLSGLLDVTDNIVAGTVVAPPAVIRYDDDDAYLIVGPDAAATRPVEGAKRVAAAYRFWLTDSFAVNESHRYDHRRRAITARGAWESVARHLRELGVFVQSDEFTVVGIGAVSDDAFGKAMLLSPHITLVGAFDEEHVFIDPHPDPRASFAERRRLLQRPGSSWRDYDPAAISDGGGVFPRSDDTIPLSPAAREALAVGAEVLTPNELIRALLRAPVDVLWNAGAGTFVKARSETPAQVADKHNEPVRIDAAELRCRAVGEAGCGGFTHQGRIEYAASGGRINNDLIDTAGAISSCDHEVNLTILLDQAVADGAITPAQRNELLVTTSDAAAERVISQSYTQALGLGLERRQAADLLDLHARLIDDFHRRGLLDRQREGVPSEARILELRAAHEGLTAPELADLLGHAKVTLAAELLESDLPEDGHLRDGLVAYLPAPLRERFGARIRHHRLRREIVASELANSIVDRQGTTFVSRLGEETGAKVADIARAFAIAVEVFAMRDFWREVRALDEQVEDEAQVKMLLQGRRLITRAARWLVDNRPRPLDIEAALSDYAVRTAALLEVLPGLLAEIHGDQWHARVGEFARPGIPDALAVRVAAMDAMFVAFDVIESVRGSDQPVRRAAAIHLALDRRLELAWLRDRVLALPRTDVWQTLARSGLRDELYTAHRSLTRRILAEPSASVDPNVAIDQFVQADSSRVRWYLERFEISGPRRSTRSPPSWSPSASLPISKSRLLLVLASASSSMNPITATESRINKAPAPDRPRCVHWRACGEGYRS